MGVGGAGTLADAGEFVTATGTATPAMYLDASTGVWQHYNVLSQPTAVLVDANGTVIYELPGLFNPDEVLARL
ncbi:MAG: hypothetical protein AAF962_05205 [Actinomycetota bacterium]